MMLNESVRHWKDKLRPRAHRLYCRMRTPCEFKLIKKAKKVKGTYFIVCTCMQLCNQQTYYTRVIRIPTKHRGHETLRHCIGFETPNGLHVECGKPLSRHGAAKRERCQSCNAKQQIVNRIAKRFNHVSKAEKT